MADGNPAGTSWDQLERLAPLVAEMLTGGIRMRIVGVGLLLVGVILGTTANVLALARGG